MMAPTEECRILMKALFTGARRDCMEKPHERVKRLSMRQLIAAYTDASPVADSFSQSLLILLLWQIQAKERSTTHLL
jgi:hypothetical protein